MRHAFLLVQLNLGQGPAIVVDPNFRDRFVYSMLPPNTTYGACVAALPKLFVGTLATITSLVNLVSSALQKEAAARGHDLPPWRSPRALMTNWLPARFSDSVHAPPSCGLHPVLLNFAHGGGQQSAAAAPASTCGSSASARGGGDDSCRHQAAGPSTVVRGFAAAPEAAAPAAEPITILACNGRPPVLNLLPATVSCNASASACCSANSSLCSSPASSCGSPSRISTAAASSSQAVMAADGAVTCTASCADGGCHRTDAAGADGARALAIALAMGACAEEQNSLCKPSRGHSHHHQQHHQQHQQQQQQHCSKAQPPRKQMSLLTSGLAVAAASAQAAAAAAAARAQCTAAAAPRAPQGVSILAAAAAANPSCGRSEGKRGQAACAVAHVELEAQQRGSTQAMAALRRDGAVAAADPTAAPAGRCFSAARQQGKAADGARCEEGACDEAVAAASSLPMRHCVSTANLTALKQLPSRSGTWEDAPARPLPCRRHPALMPAAETMAPLPVVPPTAARAAPKQAAQSGAVPGTRRCFAPRVPRATATVSGMDQAAAAAPAVPCC
ncbi:hypothetical protein HXX76_011546 [Chlamydomonas incerta]|uniref:Uncharacterized protein n=1 Tax=Chlamydomonas incerta TaxID=51695 RepID=A0A835VX78_CHLIN|nr:hypothetical protein HXX76_011546 [Chlamydomonas incerta]|eukprot:KAG2428426.1 hypothetical protein HXX76_011546 [Chlamydomonas incerta]